MVEKKEKKMRGKRSKEGELQYYQHLFYWTWVRFLSTLTPLSRSLTIKSFFWDLIDVTQAADVDIVVAGSLKKIVVSFLISF